MPVVPPPISTTPALSSSRSTTAVGFIQHMAHFQSGRLQHVDGNTRVRTEERGRRMAKTATELLLEGVEMATNNGDRTEEIPDDAVADHISPVEAYRHRLTVASTTIDTTSQVPRSTPATAEIPSRRASVYSVAAVCRRGVFHCSSCAIGYSLNNAETHRLIHSDADGQTSARWLPLSPAGGGYHRVQPSPPSPSPAIHGPFLTKMLVYQWRSPSGSCFRYCASALPPCNGKPPSSFTASAMASATL